MHIPNELWTPILLRVIAHNSRMLARLLAVNRHFYRLCQQELVWYYAYMGMRPRWTHGIAYEDAKHLAWKQAMLRGWKQERAWHSRRYVPTDKDQEVLGLMQDIYDTPVSEHFGAVGVLVSRLHWLESYHQTAMRKQYCSAGLARQLAEAVGNPVDRDIDNHYHFYSWCDATGFAATEDCVVAASAAYHLNGQRHAFAWHCQERALLFHAVLADDEHFITLHWPLRLMLTDTQWEAEGNTSRGAGRYRLYDITGAAPRQLAPLDVPDGFELRWHYSLAGDSPESVIIGYAGPSNPSNSEQEVRMVIRVDLTTRQTLQLQYAGALSGDNSDNRHFIGLVCTNDDTTGLCFWSTTTGQLLARLADYSPHSYNAHLLTAPLVEHTDATTPTRIRRHRLILTRFEDDKSHVEVWELRLPDALLSQRWQDTLDGQPKRVVPPQPWELPADPADRVHLQLLYTFPTLDGHYQFRGVYGSLLIGDTRSVLQLGYQSVVVDVETGEEMLRITVGSSLYWKPIALADNLLLFGPSGVHAVAVPPGMMHYTLATLLWGRQKLEMIGRQDAED